MTPTAAGTTTRTGQRRQTSRKEDRTHRLMTGRGVEGENRRLASTVPAATCLTTDHPIRRRGVIATCRHPRRPRYRAVGVRPRRDLGRPGRIPNAGRCQWSTAARRSCGSDRSATKSKCLTTARPDVRHRSRVPTTTSLIHRSSAFDELRRSGRPASRQG